jgi:hypothetical protein
VKSSRETEILLVQMKLCRDLFIAILIIINRTCINQKVAILWLIKWKPRILSNEPKLPDGVNATVDIPASCLGDLRLGSLPKDPTILKILVSFLSNIT